MHTIGQFSRMAMVSSSALRYYDNIGLLKPNSIDSQTGYRYYSEDQLEDILFITEMQEFGFSLDEIKMLICSKKPQALQDALTKKYESLFWEEQKITYIRKKLKIKLNELKMNATKTSSNKEMAVSVITKSQTIKTIGISAPIPTWPPKDAGIFGDLWIKYWEDDISSQIPNKKYPDTRYGILTFDNGTINYLITDEVISYESVPEGFVTFDIPKGTYAVCTFKGETFDQMVGNSMQNANDYLLSTWLPNSQYKHAESFSLELYDDRSRKAKNPEMEIWQPVIEL